MRAQGRGQVVHQADVGRVVEALAFLEQTRAEHQLLDALVTCLGQVHLLGLLLDRVVTGAVLGPAAARG